MDDVNLTPPPVRPQRPPLSEAELERRRGKPWLLNVVGARDTGPRMRRVQLTADNLDEFHPKPGQEIVLQIPQAGGEPARRHYTIAHYDAAKKLIDVDFVLHGHKTPAVTWSLEAKPGDSIEIRGPRGRIALSPDAAWHLFSGDETCIPAIVELVAALPHDAKAFAFIEIASEAEKVALPTAGDLQVTWLVRNGPPGPNRLALAEIERFEAPAGKGKAIVIGETSSVRAQRQHLLAHGMTRDQIYAEGYWRPGRVGGHDHVEE